MKTVDLTIEVSDDHTVTMKLPSDVKPGAHRIRMFIEEATGSPPLFNPEGLWAGQGTDVSSEDIMEARKDMWGKFSNEIA